MKKLSVPGLAALLLAAACGGADLGSGAADPKFAAATPTYDDAALGVSDADTAAPSLPGGDTSPAALAAAQGDAALTADCSPHLFVRTHEVLARLNRHTWKMFAHLNDAIAHLKSSTDTQAVWEHVANGIDRKYTVTKNADGTFSFELQLAPAGTTNFVTVASGTRSSATSAAGVITVEASLNFDYTALHSVIATEKATGQISMDVTRVKDPSKPAPGTKKVAQISFKDFLPEEGDAHGPRTGGYTFTREPGIGGSFSFQDSLVLLCPANPQAKAADVTAVSRWFENAGVVHSRTDAKATSGQIPTGDQYVGVVCHSGSADPTTESGFWMMKLEDSTGATLPGSASAATGTDACDPAFGAVPTLTNNANDYDFSAAVTFPGAW